MNDEKKFCSYCGKPLSKEKKGWGIEITKDGETVMSTGCNGTCKKSEGVDNSDKKLLKG